MTDDMDAASSNGDENKQGHGIFRELVSIFAPLTVLSALLYYFGFIRERAFWGHFGVDLGSVGFESTDYLVRSPGTLFVPLVILSGAVLIGLLLHHLFSIGFARANRTKKLISVGVLGGVAVALLIGGALGLATEIWYEPLISAVALGVGAGLIEYTLVAAQNAGLIPTAMQQSISAKPARYTRRALMVGLVLAGMFAATADIAHQSGKDAAEIFATSLPIQTQVVVFSKLRLQLAGTGLSAVPLDQADAAYLYRYNGLRLMLHIDDRWLLIPAGWTKTSGDTVMILKDSDHEFRVELAR